jgi:hypothetical protein
MIESFIIIIVEDLIKLFLLLMYSFFIESKLKRRIFLCTLFVFVARTLEILCKFDEILFVQTIMVTMEIYKLLQKICSTGTYVIGSSNQMLYI